MLGLIGGTGLNQLDGFELQERRRVRTAYGEPAADVQIGRLGDLPLCFLPRHGEGHVLPPHAINYRANIAALAEAGVRQIIGVAAVGGIGAHMAPGELVLPDDLIDYTWGREHSYSLTADDDLKHVEFDPPYDPALREALLQSARAQRITVRYPAVHGVTQGPRLETAAEIRRLARDGCDIVGMTGMPEAGLAAEMHLPYACLAVVVNWAAGIGEGTIHAEIERFIEAGMAKARKVLQGLVLPS